MLFGCNDFLLFNSAVFRGIYYGSKFFSVSTHVKHCSESIHSFLLIIPIFVSNFREISCSLYYFWEFNVQQIEVYFGYVLVGISLFLYTAIWIRLKNRPHRTNSEGKTFVPLPPSHSCKKTVTDERAEILKSTSFSSKILKKNRP